MIAGPFNGRGQNATRMIYQVDVPLSAGQQPYKFIVEGKSTLEPGKQRHGRYWTRWKKFRPYRFIEQR